MAENSTPATSNGGEVKAEAPKVREHLKAAGAAAVEALRENASSAADTARSAAETARSRARGATDWARSRVSDLQDRVEKRPQSTALMALGIGVVAGFLLGAILRGGRER
ncbi:MAG: hypothetical protein ACRETB_12645 [Steroidobacteraceae bacterium]